MAEVRLATDGDLSKVEALIEMLAGEVPDLEVQTLELGDGSTLVVVAEEAEGIVGCLAGRRVPPVGNPTSVVIDSVFVLPGHRSRSLGHKMVWRFIDWAIELNCPEAHVEAPISAPRAQEFLQNCGFNVRSVGRVQIVEAGLERNNVNDEEPWFSVRCHFALNDAEGFDYEERVTLWRADSAALAIERAEDEARLRKGWWSSIPQRMY